MHTSGNTLRAVESLLQQQTQFETHVRVLHSSRRPGTFTAKNLGPCSVNNNNNHRSTTHNK